MVSYAKYNSKLKEWAFFRSKGAKRPVSDEQLVYSWFVIFAGLAEYNSHCYVGLGLVANAPAAKFKTTTSKYTCLITVKLLRTFSAEYFVHGELGTVALLRNPILAFFADTFRLGHVAWFAP